MESINKVELQGNVGNFRITNVGDTQVAQISLVTEFYYKNRKGNAFVETEWHHIVAWAGAERDLAIIEKGRPIRVIGRLRSQSYTDSEGNRKSTTEIVARELKRVL